MHRDLNPPNVLVSRIGEVKLGDLGVASAASRQAVRAEGVFAGKETWAVRSSFAASAWMGGRTCTPWRSRWPRRGPTGSRGRSAAAPPAGPEVLARAVRTLEGPRP